ncbi:MAG: hypothetical protein LAO24_06025 [Acidobacteriia bacterium]|nr:hypothetical protein [Terriglobia bacterium]
MGFKLKTLSALVLILITGAGLTLAQADGRNITAITIFVYNDAHVSHSELAAAERQASLVFREARVPIAWLNCVDNRKMSEDCHRRLQPNEFVVRIVPKGQTSSDLVFGVAFLAEDGSGKYSDVFFDRIESTRHEEGSSIASLLSAVTAHEVGHLLLGSHAHSPLGIMAPLWTKADLRRIGMGALRFTPDQSSRMRERIQEWQTHADTVRLANVRRID